MKNKKIIALLCAMTMIATVLSSIFVVNAADEMKVYMSVSDKKEDGSYSVTINYEGFDTTKKLSSLGVRVPVDPELMEVVGNINTPKTDMSVSFANYDTNNKEVRITGADAAGGLLLKSEGTIATFDVKLKAGVDSPKLAFSRAQFKINDADYTMADEIFTNTVRLRPGSSEPTVEPTVEPTTEPTTDPDATTKPDATDKPSATAAPKPIKIEKPTEVTIGGLKDAKAYSIKLSDIAAETGAEMPEKVNIVIQGFDKKNVAIGYVVIPDISDFTKEYMGYVSNAAKTRINVLDAETGDPVAQVYEIK